MYFKTYYRYKYHFRKCHIIKTIADSKDEKTKQKKPFICSSSNCNYTTNNKNQFTSHLYGHIKNEGSVMCQFSGKCKLIFKEVNNLRNHILRKHFECSKNYDVKKLNCGVPELQVPISMDIDCSSTSSQPDNMPDDLFSLSLKLLSSTYLNLEAKYFLTDKSLQRVIDGMLDINTINVDFLISESEKQNITLDRTLLQNNVFFKANNPINGLLRNKYCREKYYKTFFNYISPLPISLTEEVTSKTQFYYVPILETIYCLLSNKRVFELCFSLSKSTNNDNIFKDLRDGDNFKNNSFFINNPNALQILLYQDAFEICNPLGSSRKKHKIIGIYMTVGNLSPWHRSRVDQILLVALIYEHQVRTYTFAKILNNIIQDVKRLETEGIKINNNTIKGSVVAVLGDNLGSHQIGGYVENFNTSSYFCRYCYINNTRDFNNREIKFEQRSVESYDFDINMTHATNALYRGVKSDSKLNELNYFHVTTGLPPCIAHDIYEGVVQFDLMLAITKLFSEKKLFLDALNMRLQALRFDFEKQQLPLLRKGDKLIGTAFQNLWLLMVLPFALTDNEIHDLREHNVWKMILTLRKISNILLCFQLTIGQIALLQDLLSTYINLRENEFPNDRLKPKHHFILHYPQLIRKFGPLRHLWTLRFESKHQYFKNIIRHSPNFKNVLKSLSKKHQLLQALHSSQDSLFHDSILTVDSVLFKKQDHSLILTNFIKPYESLYDLHFITKEVEYRGITYKEGMVICCNEDDFGRFNLCKISCIFLNKNLDTICFAGKKICVFYNDDSGLFESVDEDDNDIVNYFAPFKTLINVETVLHCTNNNTYYLKSAPISYL